MPAENPQIGGIVRSARKGIGLSQYDLSEKSGVSKNTINAVENNKRAPSLMVFIRLVRALGVSADLFVHPDRVSYTPEQEQFVGEMLTCNERERKDLRYLLRALRHDVSEKQS
jgi:putative transcriptional regulator